MNSGRTSATAANFRHFRCLAMLPAASSCELACDADPLELTHHDSEVVVPARYRACSTDDDCVIVSISCDGCCQRAAVTKTMQDEFERDRKDSCAGYDGLECSCISPELDARCEKERCVALAIAED